MRKREEAASAGTVLKSDIGWGTRSRCSAASLVKDLRTAPLQPRRTMCWMARSILHGRCSGAAGDGREG